MPANLPPQFFELNTKLKEAKTSEEKISILEEMLAICPKHKGTEKVQRDIKVKIAKLKRQRPKKARRETLYSIKKEGAGQIAIIGPTNSGKSSLLNALTNARAKTASYPFTTQIPQPAMMPYEDILIQLVDTPPLSKNSPSWLKAILKASDGLLAVFDLSKDNAAEDIKNLKKILNNWGLSDKKILFVGNKTDIEKLKKAIFDLLEIIRVYTKSPHKRSPDFEHPFVLKKNSQLIVLANQIHQDFTSAFKYAKLFKLNSKKPRIVGKDYVFQDKDIVEIHT